MPPSESSPTCPRCGTAPDPSTGHCGCPAGATQTDATPEAPPGPLLAQAESLFETYLAARLVRARRQLHAAKVALLRDPRNGAKLEELRRAEQETEHLQAQLLDQARRAAVARERSRAEAAAPTSQAPSAQPTEDFRAAQAVRAEQALSAAASQLSRRLRPDDRECPDCGTRVSGDATTCNCGHEFVRTGPDLTAEPFLSEEELAALRQTVK